MARIDLEKRFYGYILRVQDVTGLGAAPINNARRARTAEHQGRQPRRQERWRRTRSTHVCRIRVRSLQHTYAESVHALYNRCARSTKCVASLPYENNLWDKVLIKTFCGIKVLPGLVQLPSMMPSAPGKPKTSAGCRGVGNRKTNTQLMCLDKERSFTAVAHTLPAVPRERV